MNDIEYLQRISMADRFFVRYEGLSSQRIKEIFKNPKNVYPFVAYSDDTQLSIRTYKAIHNSIKNGSLDCVKAVLNFKRELKYWFIGLPPHLGKATAVSCLKNLIGFKNSGYPSAGNGALMRIGVIARFFNSNDIFETDCAAKIRTLCLENTVVTHKNYEACVVNLWHVILCLGLKNTHFYHTSSTLVAQLDKLFKLLITWVEASNSFFESKKICKSNKSLDEIVTHSKTIDAIKSNLSLNSFMTQNKGLYGENGVSGYCIATSAFATLSFLQSLISYSENQQFDFLTKCRQLAALGGDTDTVVVVYSHLFFNAYPRYTCLCDKASKSLYSDQDFYNELNLNFLKREDFLFNISHALKLIPKNVWLLFKMIAIRLNDIVRY